jgi:hypothetical protein
MMEKCEQALQNPDTVFAKNNTSKTSSCASTTSKSSHFSHATQTNRLSFFIENSTMNFEQEFQIFIKQNENTLNYCTNNSNSSISSSCGANQQQNYLDNLIANSIGTPQHEYLCKISDQIEKLVIEFSF